METPSLLQRAKAAISILTNKSMVVPLADNNSGTDTFGLTSKNFIEYLGSFSWNDYNNPEKYIEAYRECPPVAYIINKKCIAFNRGELKVCKVGTKANGKEITDASNPFVKLLNNPNPIQTGGQFFTQLYGYVQLNGYCIALKNSVFEGETSSILIIPPHMCNIRFKKNMMQLYANSILDCIESITWKFNGAIIPLDSVYVFTDMTLNIEHFVLPTSRLLSATKTINNLMHTYEAKGVLIKNRGALGILSNDGKDASGMIKITNEEKEQLQKDYKRYGLTKDQWQVIITSASLKWQSMSISIRDLMLKEMKEEDVLELCDQLGFEKNLLAIGADSTFSNRDAADRSLYQNNIMPDAKNLIEQVNDCLNTKEANVIIKMEFEHLECLQANKKDESITKKNNVDAVVKKFMSNGMTYDMYLEELDSDSTGAEKLYFWQMPREFQASFKHQNSQVNNNQDANNSQSNQTSQANSGGN